MLGKECRDNSCPKCELVELIPKVQDWFVVRNLVEADPHGQLLKLGEELGELYEGIAKNNQLMIIDAIGDMIVVMIGYSLQTGNNFDFTQGYTIIPEYNVFSLSKDLYGVSLENIMFGLTQIAYRYGTNITTCLNYAYNEIKDRTGKLVGNVWVKD